MSSHADHTSPKPPNICPFFKRAASTLTNMPKTSLDSAVAAVLPIDPSNASVSSAGGGGMSSASTAKITATMDDGSEK